MGWGRCMCEDYSASSAAPLELWRPGILTAGSQQSPAPSLCFFLGILCCRLHCWSPCLLCTLHHLCPSLVEIFICFGPSPFLHVISVFTINPQRPYFQLGSNAGVLTEYQCKNGKYHLNLGGCFCVPESVYDCQRNLEHV